MTALAPPLSLRREGRVSKLRGPAAPPPACLPTFPSQLLPSQACRPRWWPWQDKESLLSGVVPRLPRRRLGLAWRLVWAPGQTRGWGGEGRDLGCGAQALLPVPAGRRARWDLQPPGPIQTCSALAFCWLWDTPARWSQLGVGPSRHWHVLDAQD